MAINIVYDTTVNVKECENINAIEEELSSIASELRGKPHNVQCLQLKGEAAVLLNGVAQYAKKNPKEPITPILKFEFTDQDDKNLNIDTLIEIMKRQGESFPDQSAIDVNIEISEEILQAVKAAYVESSIQTRIILEPKLQCKQSIQKELDYACELQRSLRKQKRFVEREPVMEQEAIIKKPNNGPKRTRPRNAVNRNVSIEAELQQSKQIEVAIEKEHKNPESELKTSSEDILFERTFCDWFTQKNNLANREPSLLWRKWFGHLEPACDHRSQHAAQPAAQSMTKRAAEQLLAFAQQFQYGIDFENLPPGFFIHQNSINLTLDFDANLAKLLEPDPLSIVCRTKASLYPVNINLFQKIAENKQSLFYKTWQSCFEAEEYVHENDENFRRYLPVLLALPGNLNTALHEIYKEDPKKLWILLKYTYINPELAMEISSSELDYLKQVQNALMQVPSILQEPQEEPQEVPKISLANSMKKLLRWAKSSKETTVQLPQKTSIMSKEKAQEEDNLLFEIFPEDQQEKIKNWDKLLKLSRAERIALFQVFNEYGERGLLKLFDKWDDLRVSNKLENYFKYFRNLSSYTPLIVDEEYDSALSTINSFTGNQKAWWDGLYNDHSKHVNVDELPRLVNNFKAFCEILKKRNLSLPSTPPRSTKSMPVTLSRIISILDHSHQRDAQAQLDVVPGLDLDSQGAIRAIMPVDGDTRSRNNFVTPGMRCTAEFWYNEQPDDRTPPQGYRDKYGNNSEFYRLAYDDAVTEFWRFIGHQTHRYPLKFYTDAVEHLHKSTKLKPEIKVYLLRFLADITTDLRNNCIEKDTIASIQENWTTIVSNAESIPDLAKKSVCEGLAEIKNLPSLPLFKSLTSLLAQYKSLFDVLNINKLSEALETLKTQHDYFGDSLYDGMRFYSKDRSKDFENKKNSLFFTYLDIVSVLHEACIQRKGSRYFSQSVAQSIISCISIFGLSKDNVSELMKLVISPVQFDNDYKYAFETLAGICNTKELNYERLKQCLNELRSEWQELFDTLAIKGEASNYEKAKRERTITILKKFFSQNFPEYFLDNALLDKKDSLWGQLKGKIEQKFKKQEQLEQLEKICSFYTSKEGGIHSEILTLLSSLEEMLPDDDAMTECLTLLRSLHDRQDKNIKISALKNLLQCCVNANGNTSLIKLMVQQLRNSNTVNVDSEHGKQAQSSLIQKIPLIYKLDIKWLEGVKKLEIDPAILAPVMTEVAIKNPLSILNEGAPELQEKIVEALSSLENKKTRLEFIRLLDSFVKEQSIGKPDDKNISELRKHIEAIHTLCQWIIKSSSEEVDSKDLCYNLLFQFKEQVTLFCPLKEGLDRLDPEYTKYKVKFIQILVKLKNNKQLEENDITKLQALILIINKKQLHENIINLYKAPPYPKISDLESCLNDPSKNFNDYFRDFNKLSFERTKENAFNLQEVHQEHDNVVKQGLEWIEGSGIHRNIITELHNQCESYRKESDDEKLRSALQEFKAYENIPGLIGVLSQYLFISTGKELNSTQIQNIYALLASKKHAAANIDTGEGKSRIMMVVCAAQCLMGKTCDFITSDMELAQRDAYEFSAFFEALNIRTAVISSRSSFDEYCIDGINFSTQSQINLFRDHAHVENQINKVLNQNPEKRSLVIDEGDMTLFDSYDHRDNYSQVRIDKLNDFRWIYPQLVEFCETNDYNDDIDACNQAFRDFLNKATSKSEHLLQVKQLSNSQIEAWHDAMTLANSLHEGKDFVVRHNVLISIDQHEELVSKANILHNKREDGYSRFANGVHQCLHARLNKERKQPGSKFADYQPFVIEPESNIIYSATARDFRDDYETGNMIVSSGSMGSPLEIAELKSEGFTYIKARRHNMLQRKERPILLCRDKEQQKEKLWNYAEKCRKEGRPFLLFCENDAESQEMYDFFSSKDSVTGSLQRIDSQASPEEEKDAIKQAVQASMITITTDMVGRGKDYRPDQAISDKGGLEVMTSYLPTSRAQAQIWGRAARYGQKGSARMVLNKEALKKQLRVKSLIGFYLNPEKFIKRHQLRMDKEAQSKRILVNTVSRYRKKIQGIFYKGYHNQENRSSKSHMLSKWIAFTGTCDKTWMKYSPELIQEVDPGNPDVDKINSVFDRYNNEMQKEWDVLLRDLNSLEKPCSLGPWQEVGESDKVLVAPNVSTELLTSFDEGQYLKREMQIFSEYDAANDGRAVVYSRLFAGTRALLTGKRKLFANTRAWMSGHGILFADTRALLFGDRKLFANFRAWLYREEQSLKHKSSKELHLNQGSDRKKSISKKRADIPLEEISLLRKSPEKK